MIDPPLEIERRLEKLEAIADLLRTPGCGVRLCIGAYDRFRDAHGHGPGSEKSYAGRLADRLEGLADELREQFDAMFRRGSS